MLRHLFAMLCFFVTANVLVIGSIAMLLWPTLMPTMALLGTIGVMLCAPMAGLHLGKLFPIPSLRPVLPIFGGMISLACIGIMTVNMTTDVYPMLLGFSATVIALVAYGFRLTSS